MNRHKIIKKFSLSIVSLAIICPLAMSGLNNKPINAKRKIRTHRTFKHNKSTMHIKSHKHSKFKFRHNKYTRKYHHNYKSEIKVTHGTKADYNRGARAGKKYGKYVEQNGTSTNKIILHLCRLNNKDLYNKEYIYGFDDKGEEMADGEDGPINFKAMAVIAQQYKASHYSSKMRRLIKKLFHSAADGDAAREWGNAHPKYKSLAYNIGELMDY